MLEQANLVALSKGSPSYRRQTVCRITTYPRRRYLEYLAVPEQAIRDADGALERIPASARRAV